MAGRFNRREPRPEEIALGMRMLEGGSKWSEICEALQCSMEQARRWLDPDYKVRPRTHNGRGPSEYRAFEFSDHGSRNPIYDPRRDGGVRYAGPFDEYLGDPPIGRRALDKVRQC